MTTNPEFYSQNFEDILLARCFADISIGFYIDVGAQDEEADSVTRHFYELGWSGINIEPISEFAESFKCRERDQTICCAAGSEERLMPMGVSLASGLSSFDQGNAAKTKSMGLLAETRLIKIRRLNDILLDLGISQKNFEFLKVDVEGFELEVIKGTDLNRYRPRIILCEVTEPNTCNKTQDFDELCRQVESYQYEKIYFDGLNQWWCATEFSDVLCRHFSLPPGVMDSTTITPYSGTLARKQLGRAQAQLKEAGEVQGQINAHVTELHHELRDLHQRLQEAIHEIHMITSTRDDALNQVKAIRSSQSWRVTKPFRQVSELIKQLLH